MGDLLTPVRDAEGRLVPEGEGGIAMKRGGETDQEYQARQALERERANTAAIHGTYAPRR